MVLKNILLQKGGVEIPKIIFRTLGTFQFTETTHIYMARTVYRPPHHTQVILLFRSCHGFKKYTSSRKRFIQYKNPLRKPGYVLV